MLYHLLYPLRDIWFGFNIFKYITFRAVWASVTAFLISMLLGPWVIRKLLKYHIGQQIRRQYVENLYELHKHKEGTPTMGGVLIVLGVAFSTLLWADLTNRYILLSLLALVWLGFVGFMDDSIKLIKARSKGLAVRTKLAGQIILSLIIILYLYKHPDIPRTLEFPFLKELIINLGVLYFILVMLVIVGSSNAVNLTDGLDGLAVGCVLMIALSYAGLSYVAGHAKFSQYLQVSHIPGAGELTVFCGALAGASLGFLWFNSYPATVFMGDTGALALGGALGAVAIFIKKELVLFIAGGVFVVEALSVILQVFSFKLTRKRLFKMAPLHHHFQLLGWPESKITIRFWILAALCAFLALSTLKVR